MKNLGYLGLILAIFCGCAPCDEDSSHTACESKTINLGSNGGRLKIDKFEFEGHKYLRPRNGGGICHDENCSCKKVIEEVK